MFINENEGLLSIEDIKKTEAKSPDYHRLLLEAISIIDDLTDKLNPSFKPIHSLNHGDPIVKRIHDLKRQSQT